MKAISMADYQHELQKLGCGSQMANEIMNLLQSGQTENAAALLRRHKMQLLAELHAAGEKIDLLDFLLYQLKNYPLK